MTFTVIEGDKKAATVDKIAALQFGAVARIALMPKAKRQKNLNDIAMNVRAFSLVAVEFLGHDKAKLVELVDQNYDRFGPWLMELTHAAEDAEVLLNVLQSAKARLAIALAVVEGGGEPDDGSDAPQRRGTRLGWRPQPMPFSSRRWRFKCQTNLIAGRFWPVPLPFPLSRFPVLRQRLRPLPNQIRCSLRWQLIARPLWST